MRTQTTWFHELQALGKGPDWIINLSFADGSAPELRKQFQALAPLGYSYYHATQADCPIHNQACTYDLFIDTEHAEAIIAQLEKRHSTNIYVYHTLQACQHEFQITRGYGGYPDQHGAEETRCMRMLIQTPHLQLVGWNILYGGVTYPYEILRSGTTAIELLDYLE